MVTISFITISDGYQPKMNRFNCYLCRAQQTSGVKLAHLRHFYGMRLIEVISFSSTSQYVPTSNDPISVLCIMGSQFVSQSIFNLRDFNVI